MQECFKNVAWAEKKAKVIKRNPENQDVEILVIIVAPTYFTLYFPASICNAINNINTSIAYNVKRDPVIVCWSTTCLKDEPCWRTTCSAGCWQTWQAWGREEERERQPGLKRWLGSFLGILIKICHPSLWWWDSSGDSQRHLGPLQSIFHAELEKDPLYSIKNANLLREQHLICN